MTVVVAFRIVPAEVPSPDLILCCLCPNGAVGWWVYDAAEVWYDGELMASLLAHFASHRSTGTPAFEVPLGI